MSIDSKLKEYYLSLIYIVFLFISSFDPDLNRGNIFFSVILTGFWSTAYNGNIFKRFRDLFIYFFYYLIFISINLFKFGHVSLRIISLNIVLIISIFFISWFIGKLLILKTSIYNSVKQSVLIYFSYLFILVIFKDVLIAHSIWVIVVFIFIIYCFNNGFSFLKTFLITVPLFIIEIMMFLFDSNIFFEVSVIYFIVYAIGLISAWIMKLAFHNKKTYYFISVAVLFVSFVVSPFTQNILNQKKLNSYTALPEVFEKPLIYNSDTITLNDFKGKVLVLDFWNSACESCFKNFRTSKTLLLIIKQIKTSCSLL